MVLSQVIFILQNEFDSILPSINESLAFENMIPTLNEYRNKNKQINSCLTVKASEMPSFSKSAAIKMKSVPYFNFSINDSRKGFKKGKRMPISLEFPLF